MYIMFLNKLKKNNVTLRDTCKYLHEIKPCIKIDFK